MKQARRQHYDTQRHHHAPQHAKTIHARRLNEGNLPQRGAQIKAQVTDYQVKTDSNTRHENVNPAGCQFLLLH